MVQNRNILVLLATLNVFYLPPLAESFLQVHHKNAILRKNKLHGQVARHIESKLSTKDSIISTKKISLENITYDGKQILSPSELEKYETSFSPTDSIEEFITFILPILVPIVAFYTFENTCSFFDGILSKFITNKMNVADVGDVANGIALSSIALIFATMTSLTIGTLREVSAVVALFPILFTKTSLERCRDCESFEFS